MRGQAIRQRLATLQNPEYVENDERKRSLSVSSDVIDNARSSGNAGSEQGRQFLREVEDVLATVSSDKGKFEVKRARLPAPT